MEKKNHNRVGFISFPPSVCLRLLGGTLSLSLSLLSLTLPSLASAGYIPPESTRPPSTATGTTGGRNGTLSVDNGLLPILLATLQHVGISQSTHPTFEWFIPVDSTLEGEFRLYEITETVEDPETGKLKDTFRNVLEAPYPFTSEQGFMSYTLPEDIEGLHPNTHYVWQVVLRYGPRESDSFKIRSQIEIVERPSLSPTLDGDPQNETEKIDQIEQLAEAGLWYDALALTSQLSPSAANTQRNALFLALAEIEATDEEASNSPETEATDIESGYGMSHSEALQLIAEWQHSNGIPTHLLRELTASLPPT